MKVSSGLGGQCVAIAEALRMLRVTDAERAYLKLLKDYSPKLIKANEAEVLGLLAKFPNKRRRYLREALAAKVGAVQLDTSVVVPRNDVPAPEASLPPAQEVEVAAPTLYPLAVKDYQLAIRGELR